MSNESRYRKALERAVENEPGTYESGSPNRNMMGRMFYFCCDAESNTPHSKDCWWLLGKEALSAPDTEGERDFTPEAQAAIKEAASRDAEVEAIKAEVARFSRDANYWKWCNGCGSAKEDCEKWKDAGKVACCPECHHWPWNS